MLKLALVAGCAVAALAPAVTCQQTLVVDPDNGPWFSLQLALEAASPGDTLLVQPGVYGAPVVDKGVRVVFAPGAVNMLSFDVVNVPAGEEVVVSGLQTGSFSPHINVQSCDGRVHLEGILATSGMSIFDCAQISLQGVDVSGIGGTSGTQVATLNVFNSTLLMTSCNVSFGTVFLPVLPMNATNSDITMVDSSIVGGSIVVATAPTPGLRSTGGSLVIAGDASAVIAAPSTTLAAAALEIVNGVAVRVDPDVALTPNGAAAPIAGVASSEDVFYLRGDYDTPPLLSIDVAPADELFAAVFASLPSAPATVALFPDQPLWLDASAFSISPLIPLAGGVINFSAGILPLPPGTAIAFQAVGLTGSSELTLSTPLVLGLDL